MIMAKKMITVYLISLVLCAIVTKILIVFLKRRAKQPILKYVTEHFSKSGTPTMGGIGFTLVTAAVFLISGNLSVIPSVALLVFIIYAVIGFCDDWIKIKFGKNEGLTPLQKIVFQTLVAVIAAAFCIYRSLANFYLPFSDRLLNVGYGFIPFGIFVFLATTNCVNLTDGLDGLAASVSVVTLLSVAVIIVLQTEKFSGYYLNKSEYLSLAVLATCAAGSLSGYLLFNSSKASLFMGDTGSLGLGGLIASVYMFSGNALYIPIIGIMFVVSGISVIVQVIHFKRTKKRIFLMAPLHHHFQHKGYSECKITVWYFFITLAAALICILILV